MGLVCLFVFFFGLLLAQLSFLAFFLITPLSNGRKKKKRERPL
jgi:hypothetical protein